MPEMVEQIEQFPQIDPKSPGQGRPDAKIKLYSSPQTEEEETSNLAELKAFPGLVLQLSESISGNIFNRPYAFITLRRVTQTEELPADLKNDGDPMDDFFMTLQAAGSETNSDCGFIVMGYKVLSDAQTPELDATWKDWTGAAELLRAISRDYDVERVHCWKAVNVKPDHFKYVVLIEIEGQNMLHARDTLQKFRIRKMNGYVALYTFWDKENPEKGGASFSSIRNEMRSQESIGAIIHSLSKD